MRRFQLLFFLGFFVLMASHYVYWKDYWQPQVFFWDENYHIASAARYLQGTFFMEPHPPLGKMILALGEKLVGVNNGQTFGYEKFDIIPHQILNPAFSFAGYRFFPALFAIFNVMLFAGISFFVTRSYVFTAAFVSLPLLDTSLILHSRGAMLDSFLLFGHLLAIFAYLLLLKVPATQKSYIRFYNFLMAFGLGFAAMTKIFGMALLVLWPLLYWYRADLRPRLRRNFLGNLVFVTVFSLAIWAVHIGLGKKVQATLINHGTYGASASYEAWLLGTEPDSWTHFPQKLAEHIKYIFYFEERVAPLDSDEPMVTGSYPLMWPFGSRPIPYRWQVNEGVHRYLYLIPNPYAWGVGLAALLLSLALIIRRGRRALRTRPEITSLVVLYFAYFLPMCFITRILYLYHYFPMLMITWILFALLVQLMVEEKGRIWNKRLGLALCLLPIFSFHGYYMFRNFVFFSGTTCRELKTKVVFPFWGMKYKSCLDEENRRRFMHQFKGAEP